MLAIGTVEITTRSVVTTGNNLGDATTTVTEQTVSGCLFEPAQPVERTDSRSPGVSTPAKFYAPVALPLNADDEVICNGVTWAVVGGSSVWDNDTEIPVRRTSEA